MSRRKADVEERNLHFDETALLFALGIEDTKLENAAQLVDALEEELKARREHADALRKIVAGLPLKGGE